MRPWVQSINGDYWAIDRFKKFTVKYNVGTGLYEVHGILDNGETVYFYGSADSGQAHTYLKKFINKLNYYKEGK